MMTKSLLDSGMPINEMNAIRKHVSQVSGGKLGLSAVENGNHKEDSPYIIGAECFSFVISDVIGDDLSTIGSGPTVYDPTTYAEVFSFHEPTNLAGI